MATSESRIAILGGRGMLGSDLVEVSRQRGHEPIVLDLPGFDITTADHVERAVSDADLIVNCAAYTDVDGAESAAALAHKVNAEAVGVDQFRQLAIQSKALFSSRHQKTTNFRFTGDIATIDIAYEGILAINLPNGIKAGEVLRL